MAGTSCMDDGDRGQSLPASLLVATVADLLTLYIQKGHPSEAAEFSDLCLSLARFPSSSVSLYVFLSLC